MNMRGTEMPVLRKMMALLGAISIALGAFLVAAPSAQADTTETKLHSILGDEAGPASWDRAMGGALSPVSALASEHRGTEQDGTVHIQTWAGPYVSWEECRFYRSLAEDLEYSTTPCIHESQGWFFQFF